MTSPTPHTLPATGSVPPPDSIAPSYRTGARRLGRIAIALSFALIATGCASSGAKNINLSREEVLAHEDVKDHAPTIFEQPHTKVRDAALRALTAVGAELRRNEPYYVSGWRPNKVGLFVGSGGETVEIFIIPDGDTTTKVWVDTDLSFVGIAGQQEWNEQVKQDMRMSLAQ